MANVKYDINGEIVGLTSLTILPLDNLTIDFPPNQNLYGQTAPYPAGKNLFDAHHMKRKDFYSLNTTTGVETTHSSAGYYTTLIKVSPNTTYTLSGVITSNGVGVHYFNTNKEWIGYSGYKDTRIDDKNVATFTTPANCEYITFYYYAFTLNPDTVQLELGSSMTAYEPYKKFPIVPYNNIYLYDSKNNLLDQDVILDATDWQLTTEITAPSNAPVYKGAINRLYMRWWNKPPGYIPINFSWEEETQYIIRCWWRWVTPGTNKSFSFRIFYANSIQDSTAQSNNTTDFIQHTIISQPGKTITKVAMSYNSGAQIYLTGLAIEKYNPNKTYNDILPSAPKTQFNFPVKKNLCPVYDWQQGQMLNGGTINNVSYSITSNYIHIQPGTYTFWRQYDGDTNGSLAYHTYTNEKVYVSDSGWLNSNPYTATFADECYIRLTTRKDVSTILLPTDVGGRLKIQIESGSENTAYVPPFTGEAIIGGSYDVVTGQLTQDYELFTFDGTESWISSFNVSTEDQRIYLWLDTISGHNHYAATTVKPVLCSHLVDGGTSARTFGQFRYNPNSSGRAYFQIMSSGHWSTATEVKEWLAQEYANGTPVQIAVPLSIPVTIQLTAHPIKTAMGRNYYFASGYQTTVTASYRMYETADIAAAKRRIFLNEPKLLTANGMVAHFKTKDAFKIKSCITKLPPLQYDTTGTPSPSNIRNITGWTQLELQACGRNLLESNATSGTYSGDIQYTVNKSNGQVTSIVASGTTTSENAFFNLNYNGLNHMMLRDGTWAAYSYSDQANIRVVGGGNYVYHDVNYPNKSTQYLEPAWRIYNLENIGDIECADGYRIWARIQIYPYAKNVVVNTTIYPMWCHIDDIYCDFEPYIGTTYTFNWSSTAGQIYGGYVDAIKGQLVVTHQLCTMDGSTEGKRFSAKGSGTWGNDYYFIISGASTLDATGAQWITDVQRQAHDIKDNYFPYLTTPNSAVSETNFALYASSSLEAHVIWPYSTSEMDTLEKANNWLATQYNNGTPFHFTYELANPITYTLSPIALKSLVGSNNIFGDYATNTTVQYWTH